MGKTKRKSFRSQENYDECQDYTLTKEERKAIRRQRDADRHVAISPRLYDDVVLNRNVVINPNMEENQMENNNQNSSTNATTTTATPPTPTVVPAQTQAPQRWYEIKGNANVERALMLGEKYLQQFVATHTTSDISQLQNELAALIETSKTPEEFESIINQKMANINPNQGGTTMNANVAATPNFTVNSQPQQFQPMMPQVMPVLAGPDADRSSFSEWTTTEKIVVGIGAAALVGVTIWAIVATAKANKYKAALADAVAGTGM